MSRFSDKMLSLSPWAYWPMDDPDSDIQVADVSGNNRHGGFVGTRTKSGALSGFPNFGPGDTFSGAQRIDLTARPEFMHQTGVFAFGAIISLPHDSETWGPIFGNTLGTQEDGYGITFDDRASSGRSNCLIAMSSGSGLTQREMNGVVPDGGLHFLLLESDGTTISLYIDNQLVATAAAGVHPGYAASDDYSFGGVEYQNTIYYLSGASIAHAFILQATLSPADRDALYLYATTEDPSGQQGQITGVVTVNDVAAERDLIAISYEKQSVDDGAGGSVEKRLVVGETRSAPDGTYTLQTPGFLDEVIVLALDNYGEVWSANREYTVGQRIRPTKGNETGYGYDIAIAGNSGETEPQWWVPVGGNTQGQIGTATAEAAPLWWSVAHAPILPEPSEPPPEPLTPVDIAAMLWLHGKDAATITEALGKVSAWADKSGNDYNVEQPSDSLRPTYDPNDGGLLYATGSMALSGTIPGAVASGDFVIGIAMDYQSDGGWGSYISFLQIVSGGLDGVFWHYSKSTAQLVQFYSGGGTAVSGPMANNALGPMILTLEKVGDDYALYRDGVQLATGTKASPNLTADQSLIVGKGTFSNAKSMTGKYYEIVIAPGERQKVEGMLAWENQLETLLPFDHPYVDSRPMTGA